MSAHTLLLNDSWDINVDASGNIAKVTDDYAIAQNVANAFRLFTDDAWFFPERGIPHFLIELRKAPKVNILKVRLRKAALAIEGVADCEIDLLHVEDRDLSGMALLTLENGNQIKLNFGE